MTISTDSSADLPEAEPPEAGVEGAVVATQGIARNWEYLYKSDSDAAEPFTLNIAFDGPESQPIQGGPSGFPVVQFYNRATGAKLTEASIGASVACLDPTPPFGIRRVEVTFASHAVAPLKKGEELLIVAVG